MDEHSKRRNIAAKTIKSKLPNLPVDTLEKLARVPNNWRFPEEVTNIPTKTAEEVKRFIICFDYLNWNTCVFTHFDDTKTRAMIAIFEKVSKCEISQFSELRIVRDNITMREPYTSLFNGLSPDVEMKETELPASGRIFFFVERDKFNLVSIESKHRNIDN